MSEWKDYLKKCTEHRKRLLRAKFHKLRLNIAIIFDSLIVLASGVIAFLSFSLSIITILSTLIAIISIIKLVYDILKRDALNTGDLSAKELPLLSISDIKLPEGLEYNDHDNCVIIYDSEVNKMLETKINKIQFKKNDFKLNPIVEINAIPFLKLMSISSKMFNEKKVRLLNDLSHNTIKNEKDVYLQETTYFNYILSNELANKNIIINAKHSFNIRHEVINENKELISLDISTLSNHIGGSGLLFTGDRKIVLMEQGAENHINPLKLASSGSGSFNYNSDIKKFQDLQTLVKFEVSREIKEECNISTIDDIQICGFGRALHRNGKPDFFCIAKTDILFNDISISIKERGYQLRPIAINIEGAFNRNNTIKALDSILDRYRDKEIGCYLYWNILFAKEYIKTRSNRVSSFFS